MKADKYRQYSDDGLTYLPDCSYGLHRERNGWLVALSVFAGFNDGAAGFRDGWTSGADSLEQLACCKGKENELLRRHRPLIPRRFVQ
jgi:hypothetical protein